MLRRLLLLLGLVAAAATSARGQAQCAGTASCVTPALASTAGDATVVVVRSTAGGVGSIVVRDAHTTFVNRCANNQGSTLAIFTGVAQGPSTVTVTHTAAARLEAIAFDVAASNGPPVCPNPNIGTGALATATVGAAAGNVVIAAGATATALITLPSSTGFAAAPGFTTLAAGAAMATGPVTARLTVAGSDAWVAAAIALPVAGTFPPPPPPRNVPVVFNLTDTSNNPVLGQVTLYLDTFAGATETKTPVASWALAIVTVGGAPVGQATAYLPAAAAGTYEYDLSNGPIATASGPILPGAVAEMLATATLVTVTTRLDPVTGQPVKPYGVTVQ